MIGPWLDCSYARLFPCLYCAEANCKARISVKRLSCTADLRGRVSPHLLSSRNHHLWMKRNTDMCTTSASCKSLSLNRVLSRYVKFQVRPKFQVTASHVWKWNCLSSRSESSFVPFLLLWPPYGIGQAIIFLPCGFFFFLSSIFFPRLISAVADWISTILTHMVWP